MIYISWLAALLVASVVWKMHVAILGVRLSRWAEEVVIGKMKVEIDFPPIRIFHHRWRR